MRRLVTFLVPFLVVAAVVVVSVMSASELSAPRDTLEEVAGPVTVSGAPLPPLPSETRPGLIIGADLPSPSVTVLDQDGAEVVLGAGAGVTQVLVFLAHWCPACQAELPSLAAVTGGAGVPEGVELVAVLTGFDPSRPNWPPYAWLDREGLRQGASGQGLVRVVRDDTEGSAMSAFGLSSYPGWAVVSRTGEVVSRFSGVVDRDGIVAVLAEAARLE